MDEYCFVEEPGFDGLALNEYHGNPYCMGNVINTEAAVLARATSKAILRVVRPGSFTFFNIQGVAFDAQRNRFIALIAKHVIPAR